MGRLIGKLVLVLLLLWWLVPGCSWVEQMNQSAYRRYHENRWRALAAAVAAGEAELKLPANPQPPLVCGEGLDEAYAAIAALGAQEQQAWQDLLTQCGISLGHCSQLLDVLAARDVARIGLLSAELPQVTAAQQRTLGNWHGRQDAIVQRLDWLRTQWAAAWPQQDLDFDLDAAVRQARLAAVKPPSAQQQALLEHYYQNEYARLAMVYLDYQPPTLPDPHLAVPAGCAEVAAALKRLEAALLVRFNLDEAIEMDVQKVYEALQAGARPDAAPPVLDWSEAGQADGKHYLDQRMAISVARLKLLKYMDHLATACLDVYLRDVDLQWHALWPQIPLDTNILSFAGLPDKSQPAPALEQLLREAQGNGASNGASAEAAGAEGDPLHELSFRR